MVDNGVASPAAPTEKRFASSHSTTADRLGPLKDLPGSWQGVGFSLIARPRYISGTEAGIFLQLNMLRESLDFTPIGSPVANRGSAQPDITIYGVTYLHKVTDAVDGSALHIEPGMWLNIPATTEPQADASIARLATIPHGNSVCTVGFSQQAQFDGVPEIPPANTVPFPIGGTPPAPGTPNPYEEYNLATPTPCRTENLPDAITQSVVDDPNQLLRDALARQVQTEGKTLRSITRLITSADSSGMANIPFITRNADAPAMESVFAIETVADEHGREFLQLQYSQTVLLNFNGTSYPHVTVGTLLKSF